MEGLSKLEKTSRSVGTLAKEKSIYSCYSHGENRLVSLLLVFSARSSQIAWQLLSRYVFAISSLAGNNIYTYHGYISP